MSLIRALKLYHVTSFTVFVIHIYIIIVNARFQHLIIDYFDSQLLGIYLYAGAARDSMNLTFRTSIP